MLTGPSRGLEVVAYVTVGGTAAGALQWLVLRRRVSGAAWWIATGIGGGVAVGVIGVDVGVLAGTGAGVSRGVDAGLEVGADAAGVAAAVSFGTVTGVLQWLILQRQYHRSHWWVLAGSVGWIAGGLAAGVTGGVAGWAVLGAVYGATTGPVLVWLLRQRHTSVIPNPDRGPA